MHEPARVCVGGLSHKTAPVELREHVALCREDAVETASALRREPGVNEALGLSTCNRTELYLVTDRVRAGRRAVVAQLAETAGAARSDIERGLFWLTGDAAVAHIFRVTSGLDSLVVGESQIVAQVKVAYRDAREAGLTGAVLNRLFAHALSVGKRVRAETSLGSRSVSVSRAAVELARRRIGDLGATCALVIGAGETSELTARELRASGAGRVLLAGRRAEPTRAAAERVGAEPVAIADMDEHLVSADIVLSSTSAPHYVLTRDRVAQAVGSRPRATLLLIDLAVPRDIDPDAAAIPGVEVVDIDDLVAVLTDSVDVGGRGPVRPAQIIEVELAAMRRWLSGMTVAPTIRALRASAEEIRSGELQRLSPRLRGLDDDQRRAVDMITRSIVNKLLHSPMTRLKASADGDDGDAYAEVLRILFDLDGRGRQSTSGGEPTADEVSPPASGDGPSGRRTD